MFMQGIDDAVVHFFQTTGSNPACDAILPIYSNLGNIGQIWIAIALLLMVRKQTRAWGVAALIALACSWVFDELFVKHLFMRERPFIADPSVKILVDPPFGTSFPSGHSATAFGFASCLLCSCLKKPTKVVILLLAALMAFSRVYLCVHYLSDVLVGSLIGAVIGIAIGLIARVVIRKRQEANAPIVLERGRG